MLETERKDFEECGDDFGLSFNSFVVAKTVLWKCSGLKQYTAMIYYGQMESALNLGINQTGNEFRFTAY